MQNKTALLVDDSRVARMTLSKLLKAQDYDVVELDSGEAALGWLHTTSINPNIIFMDVTMGGMDGLTTCKEIKSKPEFATVPVVICTGNDSEAGLDTALASGAVAMLSKPPAADALQVLLDDVAATAAEAEAIGLTEGASQAAAQSNVDINAILEAVHAQLMPELQQQLQTMTADISREIAEQTAQEASNKQGLSLIPEITRQVSDTAQQQMTEIRDSLSSQADEVVSRAAGLAVDKAMESYGLTEKLMVTLRSEGLDWLNKQQDTIKDTLLKQIQHDLTPMVSRALDEQLDERVLPLVKEQVEQTQQEAESRQKEKLTQLETELKQQRFIAIGAIALAAAAIVLAFL
ncbi:response regulator [Methylophaga sp.]|uniref:response regulator n=1 Tax=Methylophaga sp. TaxID=2024840 RepID=UPI003F6A1D4C